MADSRPSVLEGVRILELARWQAAPRGGLVLRDMGAEVIKVEWRKGGDLRNSGPFVGDMRVQFAAYNRGKKSISLNTRHQKGKEIFLDMVKLADIVLENFRPGTMEKMGFGYEALSQVNPGIILASVSGFGQYGPYRDHYSSDERHRSSDRAGIRPSHHGRRSHHGPHRRPPRHYRNLGSAKVPGPDR